MADPRWTDETETLVIRAMWFNPHAAFDQKPDEAEQVFDPDEDRPFAVAVLGALADAGLLLPPGGVTRKRWRHVNTASGGSVEGTHARIDNWHQRYCVNRSPLDPPTPCATQTATTTRWPDGTELTCPWSEVPTDA